jgi:hypothetical protein
MAVGINLHLDPAVAEDPFSDHCDHVYAPHVRGDDEWCGLVVGIRSAGADGSDEILWAGNDAAIPFAIAIQKRNHGIAA